MTEEKKTTSLKGNELIRRYVELFSQYSHNNELYAKITFHVIFGQLFKHLRIYKGGNWLDPRVHLLLIQASGSGKSTPFDFIFNITEKLGISAVMPDSITDAALVGTVEEIKSKKGEKSEYEIVPGILDYADILIWDEAEMLLSDNPKQHAQDAVYYFQKALNPLGSKSSIISKKLAHGEWINLAPHCSLLLVAANIENLDEQVLTKGICQRLLFFPRDLSTEERVDNDMKDVEKVGQKTVMEIDTISIVERLKELREQFKDVKLEFDDGVIPLLKNKTNSLHSLISTSDEHIKNLLQSFIARYKNIILVLGVHHALMNERSNVDKSDINYGFGIVYDVFKHLITWSEKQSRITGLASKNTRDYNRAKMMFDVLPKNVLDSEGYVPRKVVMDLLMKTFCKTEPTCYDYVKKWGDKVLKKTIKGQKWFKLI